MSIRDNEEYREKKRRNGTVYRDKQGNMGFITTSDFTKEAKKYVREIQNGSNATPLRLINGHELAKLMIQYEVGLEPVHSYTVYRIEEEYFDDGI